MDLHDAAVPYPNSLHFSEQCGLSFFVTGIMNYKYPIYIFLPIYHFTSPYIKSRAFLFSILFWFNSSKSFRVKSRCE